MRTTRYIVGAFALWIAACTARFGLDVPMSEATQSVLLVVQTEAGEVLGVTAYERGAQIDILSDPAAPSRVSVLLYDAALADLGLEIGPLSLAEAGAPGRSLPEPNSLYERTLESGSDWAEVESWSPQISSLRLATSRRACLEAGGCLSEDGVCRSDCDPALPMAPAKPEPPRFLSGVSCPQGWTPKDVAGLGALCTAPPTVGPCPEGQAQSASASACEVIGSMCPVSDFPDVMGGIYVAVGASGGDGTLARPVGTVAEALAIGRTVVLGKGVHSALTPIVGGVVLVGACASQTRLTGGWVIDGVDVELRDLSVDQLTVRDGSGLRLRGVDAEITLGAADFTAQDASLAVSASSSARIVVEDSALRSLEASSAALDLRAVRALSDVSVVGSTVVAETVVLLGGSFERSAVTIDGLTADAGSQWSMTGDSVVRLSGASLLEASVQAESSSISLDTSALEAGSISARGGALTLRDVYLESNATEGRFLDADTQLVLRRVIVDSENASVVSGRSLVAEDVRFTGRMRAFGAGPTVTLRRLEGEGSLFIEGVDVWAEDISLRGARARFVQTEGTLELARLSSSGGPGLAVHARTVNAKIEDLEVVNTVVDRTKDPVGAAKGFTASIGGTLELRRFRLAGSEGLGLEIGVEVRVDEIRDGTISDNQTGASLPEPSWLDDLVDVKFSGNQTAIYTPGG